jgi:hypothetical protein
VICYDHRGQGRGDGAPNTLNRVQRGNGVKGLCDALGVEKPA